MASPVLSVEKHTLTVNATSTSPTDVTFIADTPPNVQLTDGTGTALPTMVEGERFSIASHVSHNGVYEVVTVTTPGEDYLVESISGATGAATGEAADVNQNVSDMATLTGSPDTTNCIPFVSTRVVTIAGAADILCAYAVRADFHGGDTVRVTTSDINLGSRVIVCEVTVVEFDPTEVNVYQGDDPFPTSANTLTLNDPYGVGVDVVEAKSFLYFTYTTPADTDNWAFHTIRGVMTDVDTLTFDAVQNQGSPLTTHVNWYVAEAINTAWAVDHVAIQLADAITTDTDTFTAVDDEKTFILGSYKGVVTPTDGDGVRQHTIDVTLTDSGGDTWDTVTATRLDGVSILDWAGFVVEFDSGGNENVYRGTVTTTQASPDPAGHNAIGATVTAADSMVHTAGMTGMLGGSGNDDSNSDDVPAVFYAWTFDSDTQITLEHYTGQATFEAATVTWEVVEWDVGGAPPRRVMVRA